MFYGAAEFSRDTDLAIVADAANFARLREAVDALQADVIGVPPFELEYLRRGHAIHFRCRHPEASRMRVDVMAKMRGVDEFPELWKRRAAVQLPDGSRCDLLSLSDLVQAKKTQRDKDWPMIRRLVEAHYFQNRAKPNPAQVRFWLQELRTPEILMELAKRHALLCRRLLPGRPLLAHAEDGRTTELERELIVEESAERDRDRRYWLPLRAELEKLRHAG